MKNEQFFIELRKIERPFRDCSAVVPRFLTYCDFVIRLRFMVLLLQVKIPVILCNPERLHSKLYFLVLGDEHPIVIAVLRLLQSDT